MFKTDLERLLFFKLMLLLSLFSVMAFFVEKITNTGFMWVSIIGASCGILSFLILATALIVSFNEEKK